MYDDKNSGQRWTVARHQARRVLNALRRDLFTFREDPLPPLRSQRPVQWLAHALLLVFALLLFGQNAEILAQRRNDGGGLSGESAAVLAFAQAVPLVLVRYRPMAAVWLSFAATIVIAVVRPPTEDFNTAHWPWTVPGMFAQVAVLTLVALRVRPRVALELWVITVLIGVTLVRNVGDDPHQWGTFSLTVVLAALLLIVVVSVRGRTEARRELTVQTAITDAERARRALLEERARIARELHDVVAHHMSVIAIQAEAAPYRVSDPPPELVRSLATIRENAVEALSELRRVLGLLRETEDGTAPQPTLERLPDLIANVREAGMRVESVVTGRPRPLPQGVELSAYRILQEALSNVLRHAPGAEGRVEVSYVLGGVGLRVVNGPAPDGAASIPPEPGHGSPGHGVMGMRERARMLDGELTAEPTADGGFEVVAFLPATLLPAGPDGVSAGKGTDRA